MREEGRERAGGNDQYYNPEFLEEDTQCIQV